MYNRDIEIGIMGEKIVEKHISAFNTRQTMRSGDFEIFHYCDSYLDDINLHHHDFYEFYFFLGGEVNYQIENRSYPLLPGDLLVISPNELHQPVITAPAKPYERIVMWIDRHYLRELSHYSGLNLEACFDTAQPDHGNLIRLSEEEREPLMALTDMLLREQNRTQYGQEAMRRAGALQLLIMINRLTPAARSDIMAMGKNDLLVDQVFSYINANIHEDLSLERLEEIFYFDSGTLTRRFKKQMGRTISQYIRQKRLTIARNMLSEGYQPIETYAKCGFADYSGFFRAFKLQYGMSPKEFVQAKI